MTPHATVGELDAQPVMVIIPYAALDLTVHVGLGDVFAPEIHSEMSAFPEGCFRKNGGPVAVDAQTFYRLTFTFPAQKTPYPDTHAQARCGKTRLDPLFALTGLV